MNSDSTRATKRICFSFIYLSSRSKIGEKEKDEEEKEGASFGQPDIRDKISTSDNLDFAGLCAFANMIVKSFARRPAKLVSGQFLAPNKRYIETIGSPTLRLSNCRAFSNHGSMLDAQRPWPEYSPAKCVGPHSAWYRIVMEHRLQAPWSGLLLRKDDFNAVSSVLRKYLPEKDTPYILDIDLDFFSTRNPFKNLHERVNLYEKLAPLFTYKRPELNDPEDSTDIMALAYCLRSCRLPTSASGSTMSAHLHTSLQPFGRLVLSIENANSPYNFIRERRLIFIVAYRCFACISLQNSPILSVDDRHVYGLGIRDNRWEEDVSGLCLINAVLAKAQKSCLAQTDLTAKRQGLVSLIRRHFFQRPKVLFILPVELECSGISPC
ncbi:UPF0489 protein C5orf22-like protein [Harpegnathos saltator]|uniref:UPF0489 protein C5orf22-like protein n=1 Tax=Harpegnathos saltator TaxID=610380 RepID=E2B2J6_HARSA|nr:UPF0489 protein C5orf22-like protein [Harpegnathos saltator]